MDSVDNPPTEPGPWAGRTVLGIFAKQPHPGRVKTRLCPPLTPVQAAELYQVFLRETVRLARQSPFEPVLFYTGDPAYFRGHFPDLPLIPQSAGDLGARLHCALGGLLEAGCRCAALIGSDAPDLPPAILREAHAALGEADAVLSPSRDGGYVLIGERRHHPQLFCHIPWSTPEVLATTRARAREEDIELREISGWEDVDDAEGLERLLRRNPEWRVKGLDEKGWTGEVRTVQR